MFPGEFVCHQDSEDHERTHTVFVEGVRFFTVSITSWTITKLTPIIMAGIMFNLLRRIAGHHANDEVEVVRQYIDDETDDYAWKDFAENMVRVMKMHLIRCTCTLHLYLATLSTRR